MDFSLYIAGGLLALVAVEALVLRFHRGRARGFGAADTWGSLSLYGGYLLLGPLFGACAAPVYGAAWAAAPVRFESNAWTFVAALVLWDFVYYWWHRAHHQIRFFWAAHEAHHSSTRFNLSTALRQAWWSPLTGLAFFPVLVVLGFHPYLVGGAALVNLLYQYWIHTELIERLGPLEAVLNTPSHHRVHHGADPRYVGRNLGGIFIVWDRLFGTFAPETQRPRYGLVENIHTVNPVRIAFHGYAELARDLWRARDWRGRWAALTGRSLGAAA